MDSAFGRYRLLERLGQGGMAEVFRAKSYGVEGFEKTLVIKRILPELTSSKDFVDMFVHEAKLAVRLSHANIVQVLDLGKASAGQPGGEARGEAYYIAMEYVHGLDLASLLARCRRQNSLPPVGMSAYVASEVAKGLDHAHRRRDEQMRPLGIVHRDVSPQNVLLSFEGEVKVTDFGIAKARGILDRDAPEDTRAKRMRGKFGYMSPEQSRGDSVDARSDLFSLGTLVYECVAGVNPFSAPTTFETLRRVQACEYPPLELLRPDAPREIVSIVKTAMAESPADRHADAGRMYEALLAFLHAQRGRYGPHELAEFLSRFRLSGGVRDAATSEPAIEIEPADRRPERTPVEAPTAGLVSGVYAATGLRSPAIDRPAQRGERREVTALVIELPHQTPDEVIGRASILVERWGGRVVRRDEGQLGALFGLDDPDGRDTEMATHCALVALRGLKPSHPPGIGLHVGRVHFSGQAQQPSDDDCLGALLDGARELARLREGRVAIALQAMREVKALFEFEPLGDDDGPSSSAAGVLVKEARGTGETSGRFVGRKEELRRIGVAMALAAKETPRVVTIRGEHGVGKTRLVHETERRLRRGGYDIGFYIATCPPGGAEFSFSGVACMLRVICGIAENDPSDRVLSVVSRLRSFGLADAELGAVLIALEAGLPAVAADTGTLLGQAFTRMVHGLCAERPHTFAWDVAHAMDRDSYALIDDVWRRSRRTRVALVLAARAGSANDIERTEGHVTIDLGELPAPEVERLVALRLGVDGVPEELLRFVRARAGGHPLVVEEVVRALVDARAVSVAERRVVSMKLVGQHLAVPRRLRGLVAARVSRLSMEERTTLEAAAVLGDPIDLLVLSTMLGQALPMLERSIATIAARDFLVRAGENELCFASPIVAEVLADAPTPEAARQMHAAAARALIESTGDRDGEHAARIGGHLFEAGDRAGAALYFAKSGERRLVARQLEAAASDYARAIALADASSRPPEELVVWLERLASSVRLGRSPSDARELCHRLIEAIDRAGGREARVRVRVAAGQVLAAMHEIEDGRRRLAEAASIAEADTALAKPVLLAQVELAIRQGDFARALVVLDRLRAIVHAWTDDQEEHRVALHFAQSLAAAGNRTVALASLAEAERLVPGDAAAVLERKKTHALVDYFTRDFRSAALRSEEAIHLGREMGLVHQVMLNLHDLGEVLVELGDWRRAYGAVQQSLALCEECGDERFANHGGMLLAYVDGMQRGDGEDDGLPSVRGRTGDADKLRKGIAYAESKDFTRDVIGGRLLLAKLLRKLGQPGDARAEFERTRSLALGAGHRLVVDDCEVALRELGVHGTVSAGESPR